MIIKRIETEMDISIELIHLAHRAKADKGISRKTFIAALIQFADVLDRSEKPEWESLEDIINLKG